MRVHVLSLGRADIGRIDDGKDVAPLHARTKIRIDLTQKAGDARRDVGITIRVICDLGIGGERLCVAFLDQFRRSDADLVS